MDIWWRITGYIRVRIVSPQPERLLGKLASQMRLWDIRQPSGLTIICSVAMSDRPNLAQIVESSNGTWEQLGQYGLPVYWRRSMKLPVLTCFVCLLMALSLAVPSRILFICVEGNQNVPSRLIQSAAEDAGLRLGSLRRGIRSEQIKNRLLAQLPELAWVGVNTSGCVATISVEERKPAPPALAQAPRHVVASCDAVICDFTVTSGSALCKEGQAVRKGQVLISGYLDLGNRTRIEPAQGEVYGLTSREVCAVVPSQTTQIVPSEGCVKKYSLLIGKKRINLYADSGILYPTCGKMTEVRPLTLPGGWKLPVCLVIDRYTDYTLTVTQRTRDGAARLLCDYASEQLRQDMIAGEIRSKHTSVSRSNGRYILTGSYACREMIGRYRNEVFIEGDAKDDGKTD